jgi:hypothetical protein
MYWKLSYTHVLYIHTLTPARDTASLLGFGVAFKAFDARSGQVATHDFGSCDALFWKL